MGVFQDFSFSRQKNLRFSRPVESLARFCWEFLIINSLSLKQLRAGDLEATATFSGHHKLGGAIINIQSLNYGKQFLHRSAGDGEALEGPPIVLELHPITQYGAIAPHNQLENTTTPANGRFTKYFCRPLAVRPLSAENMSFQRTCFYNENDQGHTV